MRVCVALEQRFDGTPDGRVWTAMPVAYSFWQRYLEVFEAVQVIARVRPLPVAPEGAQQANGEGVAFTWLPYYVGPWQYLQRAMQVQRTIRATLRRQDAAILRVGSNVGNRVADRLQQMQHPYGVEVVQDPYDAYAPGTTSNRLRPLFRWLLTRRLRRQCRQACAAAYVTREALQRRYPTAPGVFSTSYSSIDLPATAFAERPWTPNAESAGLTLISVGMMHQLYKAQDILIDAVALCLQGGLELRLILVGDGEYRPQLEARAAARGVSRQVTFAGLAPAGEAVRRLLDQADLFVLPSRHEGLPRAMIEAMARGLPCIGSTVGGFAELLEHTELVPPGDAAALAGKIRDVAGDAQRMMRLAARNLEYAVHYRSDRLRERRNAFYRHVRRQTEAWLAKPTIGGRPG